MRHIGVFPLRHPPQFFEIEIKPGQEQSLEIVLPENPEQRWKDANDSKKPLYWVLHAAKARESGKYGEAETLLRFALQTHPKEKTLWRQLAYTLPALKKKEAALNAINRYLELEPAAPDKAHLQALAKTLAPQMDDSVGEREAIPLKNKETP